MNDHYRPKGMHWNTFQQIKKKIAAAYYQKDSAFIDIAARRFPGMEF